MLARLGSIFSVVADMQGMFSAFAGRADLSPRGLFKLKGSSVLAISQGDLTRWKGDAIVNAANERMLGGGGVDGAIHRAAGGKLLDACHEVQPAPNSGGIRCPTGQARITPGFRLDAKFVIHTVGPVYNNKQVSAPLLRSAIKESLLLCKGKGLKSVAFPAISCGVYGYPAEEAAEIAIDTMLEFGEDIDLIEFVLFGKDTYVPFLAKASEKLETVENADREASPDKAQDEERPECNTEGAKTKSDGAVTAAAKSPSAGKAVGDTPEVGEKPRALSCDAPAGATSEAQDANTVEPMSQEETCGALEGSNGGGAEEPMSQETAVGGLGETLDHTEGGEPVSQSGPEEPISQETVVGGLGEVLDSTE